LPALATGLAPISAKAMTQGSLPLLTQSWMVPRWTMTSPAFRRTGPVSITMSISPEMTTA